MRQQINVSILARDGVRLSTDIRMPDVGDRFPTLIYRNPYNNADPSNILRFVEAGYAVVTQDCRGRFDSDGTFDPFNEADDGHDTVAWVHQQPWCDGRIGMVGGSYCGTTQFTAAWTNPPGLRAISPRVMGRDAFKDMLYHNGVFSLGLASGWGMGMTGRSGQSHLTTDWNTIHRHLPLNTLDSGAGFDTPFYRKWLDHPVYDDYWRSLSVEVHYPDINVPCLHMGGWYDLYGEGTIRNFMGLRANGGPNARAAQKLIIGPWAHGLNTRTLGQLDFGPQAVTNLDETEDRWLARYVRDVPNGIEHEPPIRIFVMGANVWREEQEWPLVRAVELQLFLDSQRAANTLYGDGTLLPHPAAEGHDVYTYNPDNPVPTIGGAMLGPLAGPTDHTPIERRDDVLVYTTPPLTEPIEVTGFVTAILRIASDAPDTDFVARLCDVHPDGRSIILCDGITRTRFREGLDREVMMTPGTVYELRIDMAVTSNVFFPGHRIRLEVTSSCFPRFARNLNTGLPFATDTQPRLARQTIHHSPRHPSRLILPVVKAS